MSRRCCCEVVCPTCTVVNDTYSSDTIDDYTQVSGDWEVHTAAPSWLETEDDDAICIHDTEPSSSAYRLRVSWNQPGVDIVGTEFFIYFAWYDSSNHCYLKITTIADPLNPFQAKYDWEFHSVIEGLDTKEAEWSIFSAGAVTVCVDGSDFSIESGEWRFHSVTGIVNVGKKSGVGTGDISDMVDIWLTPAKFYTFTIWDISKYCSCLCTAFQQGTLPDQIQLVIDGVTDDFCSDCDTWNGTYLLDRNNHADFCSHWPGYNFCQFATKVDSLCGDEWFIVVAFGVAPVGGGGTTLRIDLWIYSWGCDPAWLPPTGYTEVMASEDGLAQLVCDTIDGDSDLDGVEIDSFSTGVVCDWSSATVTFSVP